MKIQLPLSLHSLGRSIPNLIGTEQGLDNSILRIAFFGDSGVGTNAKAVLELVTTSDMAIHLGDFDYIDSPSRFEASVQSVVGPDFPYLATIGNHDLPEWEGSSGYKSWLTAQLNRSKYKDNCSGDYGVNFNCKIGNVHIVFSGVGTKGSGHVEYIDEQFKNSNAKWKVCTWHKNQRDYQVGEKSDEVGWAAFEKCREHGAFIVTIN